MGLTSADGSPATPLRWKPHTVCDTLDGNSGQPGAMLQLSNLIPDPTTLDSWVPRPAAIQKSSFPGFTNPGFVSALLVVGDVAYGMISNTVKVLDVPFAYNIQSNVFLTVLGVTDQNVPTSPATSGDWTPPVMAQVGTRIIVTHPGFAGGAIKFGWFDVSSFSSNTITVSTHSNTTLDTPSANPLTAGWQPGMTISAAVLPAGTNIISVSATTVIISQAANASLAGQTMTVVGGSTASPLWGSGDTNVNNLPSVPVGVAQFNGRAYFACGINGIPFSDVLLPCNRTNATQALTTNDGLAVTAVGPVFLDSPISGGIVQSIIAFEGISRMQQITGDSALTTLAMNLLPVATGTNAPLAITPCTLGTSFVSPEGIRLITPNGNVSQPIGDAGSGITSPFIFVQNPSRMTSAANADTLRISVKNGNVVNGPTQEWWFDLTRKVWTGPHTFPADQIELWRATFLMVATGINAKLWTSDAVLSTTSTFTENSVVLRYAWQTCLLPDNQEMEMNCVVESSLMISPGTATVNIQAIDDTGNVLDLVSLSPAGGPTIWDTAVWDVDVWDGTGSSYRQRQLAWHLPLVAKQLSISVSGTSVAGARIGSLNLKYQKLGYQLEFA